MVGLNEGDGAEAVFLCHSLGLAEADLFRILVDFGLSLGLKYYLSTSSFSIF